MKIINDDPFVHFTGELWWVGRQHICPRCGCHVQLERGDRVWPHESSASYLCPGCDYQVPMENPFTIPRHKVVQ